MKSILFIILAFISLHALAKEYEMNELPMYGGQHTPQVDPNKEFSEQVAALGWKYFYSGDPSTAMKRFNQAWMFDRNSAAAFWGFGIIVGQRAQNGNTEKLLSQAIDLLTKAHELSPSNGKIAGDLALSYTFLGDHLAAQGKDGKKNYEKAEELFSDAYKREPTYPPIAANWAVLKFSVGDYQSARQLVTEAQKLGYSPDPEFLKELNEKEK